MIERLVIKNLKSHESSDVNFGSGLNVFLGEVGAGKTSVLEAISLALFGRYAGSLTQRELIRRGARKAKVTLFFSIKSGRYKVERILHSKKTQKAKLWIFDQGDWCLAVEGATAVSKSIEDLLDVDSSTFLAAIYASQGEIKDMLQTQPGKRREQLDKLLGIDIYDKIWRNLGDSRNIIFSELTEAQEKASGYEVIEKHLNELNSHLESGKEELTKLQLHSKEIETKLRPAEQQLTALEKLKNEIDTLKAKIGGAEDEIQRKWITLNSLNERIEKAAEAEVVFQANKKYIRQEEKLEMEKNQIEKALDKKSIMEHYLKRDWEALNEALDRQEKTETQLKQLGTLEKESKKLGERRKELPELQNIQSKLNDQLHGANEKIAKVSFQIENETTKTQRVNELGECPTCLQTVPSEHKRRIESATTEKITQLKAKLVNLENQKDQTEKKLEDIASKIEVATEADRNYAKISVKIKILEDFRKEMQETETRVQQLQSRVEKTEEELSSIKETQDDLSKLVAQLDEVSVKAELARDAEKKIASKEDLEDVLRQEEKKLKELTQLLKKLKSENKEMLAQYDSSSHEEMKLNVRKLQQDKDKTQEALDRLQKSIEEDSSQIDRAKKELRTKEKAQEEAERLKAQNVMLGVLRDSLREVVQPVIRKNSVFKVSESFQVFYQELSNDNIDFASIDEDGNLEVIRNGEPSPINSLSGGETTCAALALRLAICNSLTKNQFLLLDEPTIHLDEAYRAKLREFLGNHDFEQLIVVTHDNTFDSLPAQIFTVEKKRGESIVTAVGNRGEN